MDLPGGFSGSHDFQGPPQTSSTPHDPARRGGLLSSLTLSVGQHLKVRWKLEIERSEAARPIRAGHRLPGIQSGSTFGREIRDRVRRALGTDAENGVPSPRPSYEDPASQWQTLSNRPGSRGSSRPTLVNFWSALDRAEREAFLRVASERTFAAGARLVHEGEPADHVIVILSGWTKIGVHEHGRERTVAERGPGQLIGERGALQVSVRSASVVALETVRALVVSTADFAAFISTHLRVLAIVEGQLYDRLTEEPARCQCSDCAGAFRTAHVATTSTTQGNQLHQLAGQNCTVLFTDVVSFASHTRNDGDRRVIREAILDMTQAALQDLGDVWSWGDRGDGLLTVVSPTVPTGDVIECLLARLPDELERHNLDNPASAQIQLRVAVNVGPITGDRVGLSGEAIIIAARLVDAPVFKDAMAENQASLGVITSAFVYETVIRNGREFARYSEVLAEVKESSIPAWMMLVDTTAASWRIRPEQRRDPLIAG